MSLEVGAALWGPPLAGSFRWPRGFGVQRTATHRHQGADFDVEEGRKWLAVANGVIEHAQSEPSRAFAGYGRVVVLRFEDVDGRTLRALYAHGKRVDVHVGQQVTVGDPLGEVGRSQFRTATMLQRAGVRVPEGYTPAMDDEGRVARASTGRGMGAHLHFELSTHAYPQSSEAPTRIGPTRWFLDRGVARARASLASRPHDAPNGGASELATDIIGRVGATEARIAEVSAQLNAAGLAPAATALLGAWETARESILTAARAGDPAAMKARVRAWLGTLTELARRLASVAPAAARAAVDAQARALAAIWEGVAWVAAAAATAAAPLLAPVVAPLVGTGALLLWLGGFWLLTAGTGGAYLYTRQRRR